MITTLPGTLRHSKAHRAAIDRMASQRITRWVLDLPLPPSMGGLHGWSHLDPFRIATGLLAGNVGHTVREAMTITEAYGHGMILRVTVDAPGNARLMLQQGAKVISQGPAPRPIPGAIVPTPRVSDAWRKPRTPERSVDWRT